MALCGTALLWHSLISGVIFPFLDSSLVRCLTLASAVRFKCSQWLIFALPLFGLNRIPFLSALQSAQCECVFTQTAQFLCFHCSWFSFYWYLPLRVRVINVEPPQKCVCVCMCVRLCQHVSVLRIWENPRSVEPSDR